MKTMPITEERFDLHMSVLLKDYKNLHQIGAHTDMIPIK